MVQDPKNRGEMLVPVDADLSSLPADIPLPKFFPPPTCTSPDGLLCVGGELSPDWLIDAYRHGIFPWPVWEDEPMAWWCPDPRTVIELGGLHISHRLRRTIQSGKYRATCDRDFEGVIRGCATAPGRKGTTWLTPSMIAAYVAMHRLGHAHSVEVWASHPLLSGEGRGEGAMRNNPHPNPLPEGEGMMLVGGTYGIAIGGFFAAESKFHLARDASKVALAYLVAHLAARGYQLFDIQQWSPHTGRLGAIEIPRLDYLRRLAAAVNLPVEFGSQLEGDPTKL
jgi:leucyl/phenylalanyl-tRNA--protein transferase